MAFIPALFTAAGLSPAAAAVGTTAFAASGAKLLQSGVKKLVPQIKPPPGAPQIDEAAQEVQASDRLRRRRGVYANIFAGNSAPPAVGKTTLGG